MTRKRLIRILRGAGMTTNGIAILMLIKRIQGNDNAEVVDQCRDSIRECYRKHGTPLPRELRA